MARGAARLEQELRKIIRGRDDVIRMALVAIFARGHLLIQGVPGVGKAAQSPVAWWAAWVLSGRP